MYIENLDATHKFLLKNYFKFFKFVRFKIKLGLPLTQKNKTGQIMTVEKGMIIRLFLFLKAYVQLSPKLVIGENKNNIKFLYFTTTLTTSKQFKNLIYFINKDRLKLDLFKKLNKRLLFESFELNNKNFIVSKDKISLNCFIPIIFFPKLYNLFKKNLKNFSLINYNVGFNFIYIKKIHTVEQLSFIKNMFYFWNIFSSGTATDIDQA